MTAYVLPIHDLKVNEIIILWLKKLCGIVFKVFPVGMDLANQKCNILSRRGFISAMPYFSCKSVNPSAQFFHMLACGYYTTFCFRKGDNIGAKHI